MASPKKTSVSIAMPVYNEEVDLPRNIPVLQKFLRENFKDYDWEIVIADNGPSKDRTGDVGRELEKKYKGVKYMLIPRSGRGGALKEVWLKSKSDIVAYMDIDLSSDLRYFSKLIKAIEDKAWFFDSEFLVVGECAGLKVTEIPIVWRDDPRSTVKVAKTAMGDLKGLYRLFRTRPWKKLKNEWKV